ncbi:MAG TPA: hypothetical protein VGK53_16285 [Propionicimonas sp.]
MRRLLAALTLSLLALAVTGCIIESEPSRFRVVNDSSIEIVLRQTVPKYPVIITVKAHDSTEIRKIMSRRGCLVGWEIVDPKGVRLRTVDKVCDGDTVVYP